MGGDEISHLHTLANKIGSTIIEAYNYSYDPAGNQTSKLDGKGTTHYTYDQLNLLLTVTEPDGKVTSYTYDAAGNRLTETVDGITTAYTYNSQNRLTRTIKELADATETVDYTYDNNGNMIKQVQTTTEKSTGLIGGVIKKLLPSDPVIETTTYSYDTRNRLIQVTQEGVTVQNTYNGEGLRVAKTVNNQTLRYLYEYDRIILETDESGNETARNIFGTNLISRTVP